MVNLGELMRNLRGVALSGALDSRGFFATDPSVRSGFGHISATIRVDSPASTEQLDQLLSRVQQCCPVLDLFRGPTPVTVTLDRQASGTARRTPEVLS